MEKPPIINSRDRLLFDNVIALDTNTGFPSVTDLATSYNNARLLHGWVEKRIDHILPQVENRERVFYILQENNLVNVDFHTFMKNCDDIGFYKYLKQLGVYKTRGRGESKKTMCHPHLWALLAMELHPQIYAKVSMWFGDQLILRRIQAGDWYKTVSKAASRLEGIDYSQLSRAMNIIVFGRHESGIRNTGTSEELAELQMLEQNLAFAIESGFIRSFDELMGHLRSVWHKKQKEVSALQ
jgi:hypothetical protein